MLSDNNLLPPHSLQPLYTQQTMKTYLLKVFITTFTICWQPILAEESTNHGEPPVKAPFTKGEDSLCVNDWWNRPVPKNKKDIICDLRVPRDQAVAFGLYATHGKVLKLTAQLYPLYPKETREVRLEIEQNGTWKEIAKQNVQDIGWSTTFRVENWDDTQDTKYRILHGDKASFEGLIRKDPKDKKQIVMAALSCNSNRDRGLRKEYTRNINIQNPDLIFFAGDQSYDHKEHTAAWLKFGLAFKELFRNRPCISIPDDHDIGQPNLWGENGKLAKKSKGDGGGYFYHPEYVRMVERQQTGNLPDAYDPAPIEQGIGVYYTNLILGGVDFAIIEDRKFKTGPRDRHPMKGPRPDHILDPKYDSKVIDVPGLKLLGERQLKFLESWADDAEGVSMKAVLSQTAFYGGAHLHGSPKNRLHADMDSNGWPQTGRNKALKLIKKANAVHIAGDQHLATVAQHGIDNYRDGPWSFVVPAIVNSVYGRWWSPEGELAGGNPPKENPLPWVGDYKDGFDNKVTMHAYANPTHRGRLRAGIKDKNSMADGWGVIIFHKESKEVTFECWPRFSDLSKPDAKQFKGWPITIKLDQ